MLVTISKYILQFTIIGPHHYILRWLADPENRKPCIFCYAISISPYLHHFRSRHEIYHWNFMWISYGKSTIAGDLDMSSKAKTSRFNFLVDWKVQTTYREKNIRLQQCIVTLLFYGTTGRIRTCGLRIRRAGILEFIKVVISTS